MYVHICLEFVNTARNKQKLWCDCSIFQWSQANVPYIYTSLSLLYAELWHFFHSVLCNHIRCARGNFLYYLFLTKNGVFTHLWTLQAFAFYNMKRENSFCSNVMCVHARFNNFTYFFMSLRYMCRIPHGFMTGLRYTSMSTKKYGENSLNGSL